LCKALRFPGSLPEGLSEEEFFEGFPVPRNKEIMRVFKDLELVEQMGSGIPRILEYYDKECFHFSDNFLRMVFPAVEEVTPQVTPQVNKVLSVMDKELSRAEIQEKLQLADKKNVNEHYLSPALKLELIEMTIPDKPKSSKQKYRLTKRGISVKEG
jgi:ATP-dependent DNA helicase RecG